MKKRKLIITAGVAVLFSCVIFASIHMSKISGSSHNDDDVMSTTQVSEDISINNGEDNRNPQTGTTPAETESSSGTTEYFDESTTGNHSTHESTTTDTTAPETSGESTTENVSNNTQDEGNSESLTEKETTTDTIDTTDDNEETTTENVTDSSGNVNEEDNTKFSFSKIIVDRMDFDYYSKLVSEKGYIDIKSIEELSEYCKELLTLKEGKKQVKYIITPAGLFDEIALSMDVLKHTAQTSPDIHSIDKRDRYLFNTLELDYQWYYSNGIGLFMIKKIQDINNDVCNNSVYAIYYYSYNTKEQLELQNSVINKVLQSFSGSEYDRVYAAHEYIRSLVNYNNNDTYLKHTAYGALVNGEAVCEGYAKAYKLLLNAMGIECDVVINSEHAWNVVCLDGEWYMVDVTNDDTNGNMEYFLLGKDALMIDNEISAYFGYPDNMNTDVRELSEKSYSEKRFTEINNPLE